MISLEEYKRICMDKNKSGFVQYIKNEFSVIELGGHDERLMEVIYKLGVIANKEIGKQCYIFKEHLFYIEMIYALMDKESFILAIDGMCGAGKSTLARLLEKLFDINVFHMDDFYLPLKKRTEERLSIPGHNVDHERFLETVLKPLSLKQTVYYQPFDCAQMTLSDIHEIKYKNKNIIEGSYALNNTLVNYYTDKIVLRITSELQIERLTKRNSAYVSQFITKWIPLENEYFHHYHIFEKYEVIDIS